MGVVLRLTGKGRQPLRAVKAAVRVQMTEGTAHMVVVVVMVVVVLQDASRPRPSRRQCHHPALALTVTTCTDTHLRTSTWTTRLPLHHHL